MLEDELLQNKGMNQETGMHEIPVMELTLKKTEGSPMMTSVHDA